MASKAQGTVPPEHTGNVKVSRPQTGAEYLESLRDGRARWTAHTAFQDPTSPPNARPRESISAEKSTPTP